MSTCDPNSPSVSFTGTLDHCTSKASKPYPVSFTLQNATGFSCQIQNVAAGDTISVTPAPSPANMVVISTPSPIEAQFNGGADWLTISSTMVATMDITELSIRNLLGDPPEDVDVEIYFAQGTPL